MAELQFPDIAGNFLASYYTAQQKQQADADRQRNMQRQDVADRRAEQQFDMQMDAGQLDMALKKIAAMNEILSSVDPANPASLDMAKQRFVQTFGGDPQAIAHITMADIPRIKMQTGQMAQELDLQRQRPQTASANRANQGGIGGSGVMNAAAQRAQLAQVYGIDPASPSGQKFVLTGQLPASLTPTDKKAILEADQMVMASQQGLSMLNQAKSLNPKAAGGFGMRTLADVFAQIGDETALNTRDLENVLQSNVLPQLKVIFGGAPTEGERQILLDLQGSASKTVEERRRIIGRSIAAANARIKFYQDQANELRGGTYYSPTRGQLQLPAKKKKTTLPSGVTIEELD